MPEPYLAQTLTIEGADAVAFAQAQFSSNVATLAVGHWQFSAWLDAQGRVRALFHLARPADDRLLLLLRGGDAAAIAEALKRFVFRAKARIEAQPPRRLATGEARPLHALCTAGGIEGFGCGDHSLLPEAAQHDERWRLVQLRAGWPWLPDALPGELLASTLRLERLHATSIDKGCYPGQEIVARLHYRGGNKRHMQRVVLSQAVEPGTLLRVDERDAVQLLDVVPVEGGAEALAVMHDAFAERLAQQPSSIDGIALRVAENGGAVDA
ncbi:folate-binding protein [Frateuria sp. Soil773]|uniref:CAF17-like 4Fe-4S cluster assembly/insertion protein YgfZ n=1 Tax=Frateuria sp. Soil773 TaxID=1736407 RepID=UPI0006F5636E|nr:folate-binding protein [Frateuria sp. Soil773]KRE92434.1 folate-binding protein [Frateuria sp. Soil773]